MADPAEVKFWRRLDSQLLVRFLLFFAAGWAFIQLLAYFQIVVLVFVSATILAFLLHHPVAWLRRWLPHTWAVLLVFITSLIVIGGLGVTIGLAGIAQGQRLTESLGDFLESFNPLVIQLEQQLQQWNLGVDLETITEQVQDQAIALLGQGVGLLQGALANFVHSVLIAVVTFFMLLDGARLWGLVLKLLPPHQRQDFTTVVQKNLLGFFWGRLLLSIFFGASTFVVFLLLKVPFALILAVIAGVFDLIPGIGATLGISLVALLLLSQSVWLAVQALVICITLQQVEENLLLPHIMRGSLDINPVVMFFALIVGARVAGLMGVFLAIPVAGTLISWLQIEEMKGQALQPAPAVDSPKPPGDQS